MSDKYRATLKSRKHLENASREITDAIVNLKLPDLREEIGSLRAAQSIVEKVRSHLKNVECDMMAEDA